MVFHRSLVTLVVLALTVRASAAQPGPADRWRLIFSDEFDGPSLDTSKWNYHYPWSRTHNHLAYSRSRNVSVEDGKLVLTALEEDYGGKEYTTGVVNTNGKFHVTYGYIEARIRMPSSLGSWPAFWTLQGGWPPEIDIMEFPLSDTSQNHNEKYRYWWNYHWGTVEDHRSAGSEEWVSSDLTRGYHTYAVEWLADAMTFYFDGEVRGRVTDHGAIDQSRGMYLILNFAVGGWPGTPPSWPAEGDTYKIDWVRVWQPAVPDSYIDLGDIVGGGSGDPATAAPHVGIHPATGAFSDDLDVDRVDPSGSNPQPVDAEWIDSVFLMVEDLQVVNTAGTRFRFPAGDAADGSWDLIANVVEPDGSPGVLRLGSHGPFIRGIGIHAASGITFDLEAIRRKHGDERVAFFSTVAGEGSLQAGGVVNNHVLLADPAGRLLFSETTGPHQDDGRFLEVELPRNARFLTLATGAADNGTGQDHGVFCNACITECSVSDPGLCEPPLDEMLVFSGSTWKYLDTGAPPPTTWIEPSFFASSWKTGRAELGYGEDDEATVLEFGGDGSKKRITTYFRRTFSVRDAAEMYQLSLRLLRDDGAVVYLNGTEVFRSNMPVGNPDADTLASTSVSGDAEGVWVVAAVDPCVLRDGTNTVAVEVHQASPTSSDVSFDLALAANRDQGTSHPCGLTFRRGECNGDGDVDISDAICVLEWLYQGREAPRCLAATNINGDPAGTDLSDAVYLLHHLYVGGSPPVDPFPDCGPGLLGIDAELGCEMPPGDCP